MFADELLLIMAGVALWKTGVTPMPLVPLCINRMAELLVMLCTNSVIHLWMSVIQVILAVLACVLFKFADPVCTHVRFSLADDCGSIMLGIVACVMELSILGSEVIYHVHAGNLLAPREGAARPPHAGDSNFMFSSQPPAGLPWPPTTNGQTSKDMYVTVFTPNGGNFQVARVLPSGGDGKGASPPTTTSTTTSPEPYPDSPTLRVETGGSPPLAMHLYQLNARAVAASNWLREGAVASDWWQMPAEEGAGSPQLTIRGLDGAPIALEEVPTFRPVAHSHRQGRRAPLRFSRARRSQAAAGASPLSDEAARTPTACEAVITVEDASPPTRPEEEGARGGEERTDTPTDVCSVVRALPLDSPDAGGAEGVVRAAGDASQGNTSDGSE